VDPLIIALRLIQQGFESSFHIDGLVPGSKQTMLFQVQLILQRNILALEFERQGMQFIHAD